MQKLKRAGKIGLAVIIASYFLLLIPDGETKPANIPAGTSFVWGLDPLWQQLENKYVSAKSENAGAVDSSIERLFAKQKGLYDSITAHNIDPPDTVLDNILSNYFELSALVAARLQYREKLIDVYNKTRREIKHQSVYWNDSSKQARNTLYKILYGMRVATEEVLLQAGGPVFTPVINVNNEPSATPAADLFGIKVHSGDLLVSRGGAAVSALISRGNNYPGNFSHVALLYVEERSGTPYLIEAHIEKGVAISSAEQYIEDKKLRFMVLRPRADLLQVKDDPMLPHKAAMLMYTKAKSMHIPYDFKMNFYDSSAMFCSEVGSYAYKKFGLRLWQKSSVISSPGVTAWLNGFGVENFITQMPSDLEYDPQLSVVAEWRNPETLLNDHIDNAVMDVLFEQADKGKEIGYNIWQLPLVRAIKGWCMIKNSFGGVGIIPEGMSATRALKNNAFVDMYEKLKIKTRILADQFMKEYRYYPPYWQLVALAKEAAGKSD